MTNNYGRPIRILELRSVWGSGGGPDKTILLGTYRSDPSRFAVTACYIRDARDQSYGIETRPESKKIDYIEVLEKNSFDPKIWPVLRKLVRERAIDIVHAHDYKTDLIAWLLSKSEGILPLSTAHGWSGHSWKETKIYYPLDRQALRFFPRVIAVSKDIKQMLVNAGTRSDKITVVPNGIDLNSYFRDPALKPQVRCELGLSPEDIAIGAVGRLESEKNYPLLLKSFAEVHSRYKQTKLLIAGDGSLKAELSNQAKDLHLGDHCRFLGQVSDIRRLHHALDMLVICSDNEGSPNTVLEAMALGTPVVATNVGGLADMVRPSIDGWLVQRRDQSGLIHAMLEMIENAKEARRRAESAQERIEQEFTFEARMKRVEAIYDDLASGRRGHAIPVACNLI
jgi:glycosyltransferase involved in cell wall biosynthesis